MPWLTPHLHLPLLLGTGCSSWQTPGDVLHRRHLHRTTVLAKGSAVQLGGLHPPLCHDSPGPTPFPELGPDKTFRESCAMLMFQRHMFLKVADVSECCLPILFGLTTALGAFPLFITFESRSMLSAFMEMQFMDPPFSSFPCTAQHFPPPTPLPSPWALGCGW